MKKHKLENELISYLLEVNRVSKKTILFLSVGLLDKREALPFVVECHMFSNTLASKLFTEDQKSQLQEQLDKI